MHILLVQSRIAKGAVHLKIVSWKYFFITAIGGGGVLLWTLFRFDGVIDLFMIIFILYLIMEGMILSFSKEAYEEAEKKRQHHKQLLHKLFGRFALIIPFTPLLLVLLAVLCMAYLPDTTAFAVLYGALLVLSLGLAIGLKIYISNHDKEKEAEQEES